MNSKNSKFQYKIEHAKNFRLNFLDTTLKFCKKSNSLELQHFEKKSKSQITINFRHATAPKTHKRNAVVGALNRIKNATTNKFDEEKYLII